MHVHVHVHVHACDMREMKPEQVHLQLKTFDASKASCFDPADRESLLSVVEISFGSIHQFNTQVQEMLRLAMGAQKSRRQAAGRSLTRWRTRRSVRGSAARTPGPTPRCSPEPRLFQRASRRSTGEQGGGRRASSPDEMPTVQVVGEAHHTTDAGDVV